MGNRLNNQRGETLMEGIVSILIFTVLIATVTMVINVAFRMTTHSYFLAEDRQMQANVMNGFSLGVPVDGVCQPTVLGNAVDCVPDCTWGCGFVDDEELTFIITMPSFAPVNVIVDVNALSVSGFISFELP
jgi:hypothetical protein